MPDASERISYMHDGGPDINWVETEIQWDRERSCYRLIVSTDDVTNVHRWELMVRMSIGGTLFKKETS